MNPPLVDVNGCLRANMPSIRKHLLDLHMNHNR